MTTQHRNGALFPEAPVHVWVTRSCCLISCAAKRSNCNTRSGSCLRTSVAEVGEQARVLHAVLVQLATPCLPRTHHGLRPGVTHLHFKPACEQ